MAIEMSHVLSDVAALLAADPLQRDRHLHMNVQTALSALEVQRVFAPKNPLLGDLGVLRESFTGTGPKTCQCCGRPF